MGSLDAGQARGLRRARPGHHARRAGAGAARRRCSRPTSAARPCTSGGPPFRDDAERAVERDDERSALIRIALLVGVLVFGGIVWYLRRSGDVSYSVNPRGLRVAGQAVWGLMTLGHARAVRRGGPRVARASRVVQRDRVGARRSDGDLRRTVLDAARRLAVVSLRRRLSPAHVLHLSRPQHTLGVRVVSFLPSATEIVAALGHLDDIVGISHECDFPPVVRSRDIVTSSAIDSSAASARDRRRRSATSSTRGVRCTTCAKTAFARLRRM